MRRGSLAIAAAASAMSLVSFAEPKYAAPGEGRRHQPTPPYKKKTPVTDADFARISLAEQKRARQAARQAKGMRS